MHFTKYALVTPKRIPSPNKAPNLSYGNHTISTQIIVVGIPIDTMYGLYLPALFLVLSIIFALIPVSGILARTAIT